MLENFDNTLNGMVKKAYEAGALALQNRINRLIENHPTDERLKIYELTEQAYQQYMSELNHEPVSGLKDSQ